MKITGCIVTYNDEDTIERCVRSILTHTKNLDFTLYISDNHSTDSTVAIIKANFPEVIVLENEKNGGFGYGHNKVLDILDSEVHFVINPDIYMKEDSITELSQYVMKDKSVALITPKILNIDKTEQFLPKKAPTIRYVFISKLPGFKKFRRQYTRQEDAFNKPSEVDFCTGCFFGVRTDVFKKYKGFSDRFYMYFEDADLSKQVLRDGMKIIFYPLTAVFHDWNRDNTGSIRGIRRFLSSMIKYFNKWGWKY